MSKTRHAAAAVLVLSLMAGCAGPAPMVVADSEPVAVGLPGLLLEQRANGSWNGGGVHREGGGVHGYAREYHDEHRQNSESPRKPPKIDP